MNEIDRIPLRASRLGRMLSLVTLLLAGGCAVQPAFERPALEVPAQWRAAASVANTHSGWPSAEWWRSFSDPVLEELVTASLAGNFDIKAAGSRIDQARARVRGSAALRSPVLEARLGVERESRLDGRDGGNTFTGVLAAVFEPDLWEKYRNTSRAAEGAEVAAHEGARAVASTVVADAVTLYFQLGELDERIELVERTIVAAVRIDTAIDARYKAGSASGLDRAQSRNNVAAVRAGLQPLKRLREETLNALALLSGRAAGTLAVKAAPLAKFSLPDRIPVGLPSELLQRRPDIRQAEANLAAAYANVGVARASLYPNLTLTAEGGLESASLRNFLTHGASLLTLGANLLAPIFDAGRRQADTDVASARYQELVHQYRQVILAALADVENALVGLERLSLQESTQETATAEAGRAFELAEIRHKAGLIDTITLLNAQRTSLDARNALVQIRFGKLAALVRLYRALGGGVVAAG